METAPVNRETLRRRFEEWLDEALAEEEPPAGLAEEFLSTLEGGAQEADGGRCDLYSVWAALTAMTQEVKLQGRSFKQLGESLAPVVELSGRVEATLSARQDAIEAIRTEAETNARREVLGVLLDLKDRLDRSLDAARGSAVEMEETSRGSWLARILPSHGRVLRQAREAVAAIQRGYELNVERLEEILEQYHVREIDCLNQPFDHHSMSAVDVEETDEVPEGTVVAVYRRGYEWRGATYRTAQVKVTRGK